jgi:hypothetical protein
MSSNFSGEKIEDTVEIYEGSKKMFVSYALKKQIKIWEKWLSD